MRLAEQEASARLGGYEFELLRLPDGRVPREACLAATPELLAALWKAIRDFQPDYLFCPPLPSDPLAGIHVDHLAVAEAVRKVAYMINVPQAFSPEYPPTEPAPAWIKTPVIIHVYDPYSAGANAHDLAVDVEPAFAQLAAMSWCHQSQISEWLPWVGRHKLELPRSEADWAAILRRRFGHKNRDLGLAGDRALEVFTVTGWGSVPTIGELQADFPELAQEASHLDRLRLKLARWGTI
jgi:LmbE family N-acetylglucosaminyl deacetylase